VDIRGSSIGIVVDSTSVLGNNGVGINVTGTTTETNIVDSIISSNNGKGINTDSGTGTVLVESCTIQNNGSDGIDFDGLDNRVNYRCWVWSPFVLSYSVNNLFSMIGFHLTP